MYLEFFAENGIVAGGLFLYILIVPMRSLIKLDRYLASPTSPKDFGIGFAMAMSILAILLGCLFLSEAKNAVLWFLIGIGFSSVQVISRHYNEHRIQNAEPGYQSL